MLLHNDHKPGTRPLRRQAAATAFLGLVTTAALANPAPVNLPVAPAALLEEVVVTATRESRSRLELPESVGVLSRDEIRATSASHPGQLLNRLAGVHVNDLGGEGHMTAIRQPLTTGGVYLFLEDGIPTRPTGFFNHNGLYEMDLHHAQRVEVTRGPGSALYGSDAIGGMINSITRAPGETLELGASLEANQHDGYRVLLDGSGPLGGGRDRLGLQLTLSDQQSFRDNADYRRASWSARWDRDWSSRLSSETVVSQSRISQSGASALEEADYRADPAHNLYRGDVGYREVRALRISSRLHWEVDERLLWSLTGFARDNRMDLMPFWMLSYDPNIYTIDFQTLGLQLKRRQDFALADAQWIVGLDADYTPSRYREQRIDLDRDAQGVYLDYHTTGRDNYHFDADQLAISPYTHLELQATERLRLSAGLRFDHFTIDYDDRLDASVPEIGVFGPLPFPSRHYRPEDGQVTFQQWTPKLGLVLDLSEQHNLYASYRHAFRAPTAGQLFRGGAVADTTHLDPVRAESRELGLRGLLNGRLQYDVAVYDMLISDDIVSLITEGTRKTVNSGETRHRGVELSLQMALAQHWQLGVSWSHARHEYRDFQAACGGQTCRFDNNALPRAPRDLGNLTLAYTAPGDRWRAELEWQYLGKYYTDEANSKRYPGHDLLNLRAELQVNDRLAVYARLLNLGDSRYATYVSNQVGNPALDYRPGQPRTAAFGLRWDY